MSTSTAEVGAAVAPVRRAAERRVTYVLGVLILASFAFVTFMRPGLVRFWPLTLAEFTQFITPLFLVSLFIERTLEVFLTAWRAGGAKEHKIALKGASKAAGGAGLEQPEVARRQMELETYRAGTQRVAFMGGVALGLLVAAVGIRVLEPLVDPAIFQTLPGGQQAAFRIADVVLTAAVLGGGADGLHKIVATFTDFLDATSRRVKDEPVV